MRNIMGRVIDRIALALLFYVVLFVFFTAQTQNMLWGALMALPVTLMALYALRLWRRRKTGAWTVEENIRYHLQMLMLAPREQGLRKLIIWLAHFGVTDAILSDGRLLGQLDGRPIEVRLLQKPLEAQAQAEDVLKFFHAVHAPRGILVSTAAFSDAAAVFARQCTGPRVALVGPRELRPVLKKLPAADGAPARDAKKRRQASLSELKKRAADVRRQKRYLLYGTLMIMAYILFNSWAFLVPGLVCVFLAVIARRSRPVEQKLFSD